MRERSPVSRRKDPSDLWEWAADPPMWSPELPMRPSRSQEPAVVVL